MNRPALLVVIAASSAALAQPTAPTRIPPVRLPDSRVPAAKPPAPAPPPAKAPDPPAIPPTQPPAAKPVPQPADGAPSQPLTLDQLPPHVRLAARVETVRQHLPVIQTVVVVPDAASYVAAVSSWTIAARFPVLIDDGSWPAQQDIARFVRAFEPSSVVRWKAPPEQARDAWPADAAGRRSAIENAVARAWGAPNATGLLDHWKSIGLSPPGVVVAWPDDPAWTAALALAAGHAQPILWIKPPPGGVDGDGQPDAIDSFSREIEKGCESTGLTWRGIGDDLDAVSLCLNMPTREQMPAGDPRVKLAVTDLVGRPTTPQRTPRWAWAGHVFGSEPQAAYRAMCALFVQPRRAWVFDGYEDAPGWNLFDGTKAAAELRRAGLTVAVNDRGAQSADHFRRFACGRAAGANAGDEQAYRGGTDAGLIAVNTKGDMGLFHLMPGDCLSGDVPLLSRPAIVYFVHSFSALLPGERSTIAGRFLEHGAYAYMGSVWEPTLQAFVPTPLFARRFAGQVPWGAAVRYDDGPPKQLAVFGDPLLTFGPPAPASKEKLPLAAAADVADAITPALKARRYADAMQALSLLARDADAATLLASLLRDQPELVNPDAARTGIMSAYFAGRFDVVIGAYGRVLPPRLGEGGGDAEKLPILRDLLWHTLWPTMNTLRPQEIAMLEGSLRLEGAGNQIARDGGEVARAIRAAAGVGGGEAAVRTFVDGLRARLRDETSKKLFEMELAR